MKKFKSLIYFLFILLFTDLLISALFLKNTSLLKNAKKPNYDWRVKSNLYHHTFKENSHGFETWNFLTKSIFTNSIGFRDDRIRNISKVNKQQKRILVLGDSFIEGAGYDYKYTVAGLLKQKLSPNFEILNGGVASYSSGPYFLKTKDLLKKGYKFDYALIFLDLSDIHDELDYKYDKNFSKILHVDKNEKKLHKKIFYSIGDFLIEKTITFKFLLAVTDNAEILKNYLKLKYKASKLFKKNFFETSKEDALFYRMINVDRGAWPQNYKNFKKVEKGFAKTQFFLKELFQLLRQNNIESYLIIYPWPNQIYFGDKYHEPFWEEFSQKNNINFLSLYKNFDYNTDKRKIILDNFIFGDVHWNKQGNKIISDSIVKKIFSSKK